MYLFFAQLQPSTPYTEYPAQPISGYQSEHSSTISSKPIATRKKKKKIKKKSPSSVALSPFASACHHHHVILGYLRQPQSSPGAAQSERSCPKPKTKCPQCSPPALTIIPLTSDTARPNTTSTGKQKPFFLDPSFATAGWQLAGIFIHNSLLLPYRVSGQ